MTLEQFRDVLLGVTEKTYHNEAQGDIAQEHIIWQETGKRALHGDDMRTEVVWEIQIDVYTKDEYSPLPEKLQMALEENDIAFSDPVITYERETGLTRCIIECEVI
ncbi:MAG: hypothetical protein J6I64_07400 [Lachnospiraceae bacterium]|nr:hypothetical protein [Lachnospiraceae bacterium]